MYRITYIRKPRFFLYFSNFVKKKTRQYVYLPTDEMLGTCWKKGSFPLWFHLPTFFSSWEKPLTRNNFESKVFLNEVRAFAQGRQQGDELRWIIVFFFFFAWIHISSLCFKGVLYESPWTDVCKCIPSLYVIEERGRGREMEGVILDWIFLPAGQNKFFCFCWIKSKLHIAKSCFMFYYFVKLYLTLLYL